jgi:hypothetical protein
LQLGFQPVMHDWNCSYVTIPATGVIGS